MSSAGIIACSRAIASRRLSIAFVESATAGRLCYAFSQVPDAGKIFKGGLVCYDACLKEDVLHIPAKFIEKYTPESAEVTAALAERLPRFIECDISVAVTGLTSTGGSETRDKPVGTMFFHIIFKNYSEGFRKVFAGSPEQIVSQAVDYTAFLLLNLFHDKVQQ